MSKIVEEVKATVPSKVYMLQIKDLINRISDPTSNIHFELQKNWCCSGEEEPNLFSVVHKDRAHRGVGCLTQIYSDSCEAQFKYLTEAIRSDKRLSSFDELCTQVAANWKSKKVLKEILMPYAQWQTYLDKRLKRSMCNEVGLAQTLRRKIVS